MTTFFQAISEKFTTDHNASVEYNNEVPGKGDYLCGKAQAYADVLDMLNSEYAKIKNYSPASPVQQSKAGSEDSTQISAFVNWVASLSKTEYAAHQQLIAVINQAQKLLPC